MAELREKQKPERKQIHYLKNKKKIKIKKGLIHYEQP